MGKLILPDVVAVGVYDAAQTHRGKTVTPNRKTTMFELELPLGAGGISYINENSNAIAENVLICAKPGQVRHTRLPFKCYYVHMVVGEGVLYDLLSALPDYIKLKETDAVREIFEALTAQYELGTPESILYLQSLLLKLVYLLSPYRVMGGGHRPKSNHHEIIERMLAYIDENPTADLRLEGLAEMAGFSPVHFHKLFKASTGKTLRTYIEERRIKRAIGLLTATDMTLTEIAYECGFSSQAYFSYAFKKRMGVSPREYVKSVYLRYER